MLGLALAACEAAAPSGQVVARIDQTDVTERELAQERRVAPAQADQQRALDRLVTRKILAEEARARGLEQDGDYHFALRDLRERLLVEALQRDLARSRPVSQDQIAGRIAQQPWRYRERFRLDLAPADASGGEGPASLDSASFDKQPSAEILAARTGDTITLDGRKWRVAYRTALTGDADLLNRQARQAINDERSQLAMEQIVANYRQTGRIRYQKGLGPSGR